MSPVPRHDTAMLSVADDDSSRLLQCGHDELLAVLAELVKDLGAESPALVDVWISNGLRTLRLEVRPDSIGAGDWPLTLTATPLTTAEIRVLRYLPTNLTFAAIGDALCVSRNTVKTQAISIYRKLNVTSRHEAVQLARKLGLLAPYGVATA